jgi:hypothetical protein
MPMEEEPIVGAVYEDAEGRSFEVLSFDEDEATIQIKYEDGTVEDMDLDAWYELDVQQVETDDEDLDDDVVGELDDEDEVDEDEDEDDLDDQDDEQ